MPACFRPEFDSVSAFYRITGRLFRVCYHYSNIAEILAVSSPTVKDYFRIAHGAFIWRTLPAYSKNSRKRVVRHPRGYLRDSGLLHHILHIPSYRRLLAHPQMGVSWGRHGDRGNSADIAGKGRRAYCLLLPDSCRRRSGPVAGRQIRVAAFEIKHTHNVSPRPAARAQGFRPGV